MRSDAAFELWLDEIDEKWRRIFRRATWQMGALMVGFQICLCAALFVALRG